MNSGGSLGAKLPTIAVFTKNKSNPSYAATLLGAELTAQRMGARVLHYVPDKPDDADQQIALIDLALAQHPDAITLVPVHPTAINSSIRKIHAAGIPVVGYINRFTEPGCVSFVGSEDYPLAVGIATYLFKRLEGRGTVVIVEGWSDSVTSLERVRGFHDALRSFLGIRLLTSVCGEYQREPARRVMAELLGSSPRIDGVIAANDIMALGILDALAAAGRNSLVIGVNAIPEAITAIKQGRMLATADFDSMKMGCLGVEAAIRHLRGEVLPKKIILPVQIVDLDNCDEWDKPFEQRPCPRWEEVVGLQAQRA